MNQDRKLLFQVNGITIVFSIIFSFLFINTELHFHHQQIAWLNSAYFFKHYLSFAGGPAEYLTLFISQFFSHNWAGSLIVALIAFLISFLLYQTLKLKWKILNLSYFLLPVIQIVIVALMCNYNYHFSITINLLLISLILFLCETAGKRFFSGISYHILIAGFLVYYLSGGIYYLIFMLTSLISMTYSINRKTLISASLIIIEAILLPYIANKFIFLTSMKMSYFRAYPEVAVKLLYSRPPLFYVSLGMIPFLFFMVHVSSVISARKEKVSQIEKDENGLIESPKSGIRWIYKSNLAYGLIIWFVLSTIIIYGTYHSEDKIKTEVEYLAYKGEWNKVIDLASKNIPYDRMINFQYNRALLHTGQLLNKLFSYEQLLGSQGLFLDRPFSSEVAMPISDLYFDLGNIDESQRLAFEAQTSMPYSPHVLERLAQNCIILGNMKAARTFLNVLGENPEERKWAKNYEDLLNSNEKRSSNALISEKIRLMNKIEGFGASPRGKMINLLQHNPTNKSAFEYLIAFDLMEHDLASFIEDMKYIVNFDYTRPPKVIEEAVILFRSQRPDIDFLKSFTISAEAIDRFQKFAALTRANSGNREKAKQATLDYKDTYWYYVLFLSPLVTKVSLETHPVETNY